MKQSVEVVGGPSQLVHSERLAGLERVGSTERAVFQRIGASA
jgi:hypothetical protein